MTGRWSTSCCISSAIAGPISLGEAVPSSIRRPCHDYHPQAVDALLRFRVGRDDAPQEIGTDARAADAHDADALGLAVAQPAS
jgi:hypothetical protein